MKLRAIMSEWYISYYYDIYSFKNSYDVILT